MDDYRDFKETAARLNTTLTLVHIFIIASSFILKTWIVFGFNIVAFMFYIHAYKLIMKKHVVFYLLFSMIEIFLQMIISTVCLGWDSGFHLDAFATISAVYYTKYIYSREQKSKYISLIISIASICTYLGLWIYTRFVPTPIYVLPKKVLDVIYLLHSGLIFALTIQLLWTFTTSAILEKNILKNKAELDELTLLYNRHKVRDFLGEIQKETEKPGSDINYSVCIFDIDDFKMFNDTYGHDAGDIILKETATILKSFAQDENTIMSRWGGEEFLVLQKFKKNSPKDEEHSKNITRLILETVRNRRYTIKNKEVKVTLTGGYMLHQEGMDIASTMKEADKKLYEGKGKGKNVLVF